MKNSSKTLIMICSVGISISFFGFTPLGAERQDDPVLARVNGAPITQSQLTPLLDQYREKSKKDIVGKEERLRILQGLITRELILQQKESKDLRKDERIVRKVKELEDQLVVGAFLEKYVRKQFTVTDEEIKEYYEQNLTKFVSPPKVKARHILLRTRKEAEQVMEKLRNKGDFAKLAKEYSTDLPMALEGGSMGTIEKGRTLPELEKVLFTLNVGETSGIVETRFGFHILTVDEKITNQHKPLEEVREGIKKTILIQKESRAFDEISGRLEKKAKVEVFEDRVQAAQ